MGNIFIKWPKGLRAIKTSWEKKTLPAQCNEIRGTFNPQLYLDYLRAINEQPEQSINQK